MSIKKLLQLGLLCLFLTLLLAEDSIQAQQPFTWHYKVNNRPATLVAVPVLLYDLRTSLGFGILAGTQLFMDTTSKQPSNVQFYVTYTLRNQLISKIKHFVYLNADCLIWKGELMYQDFEEDTYAQGGLVDENFRETLRYKSWLFNQQLVKRINTSLPLYFGISYQFERFSKFHLLDQQIAESPAIRQLINTSFIQRSMFGLGLIFDSRDNQNAAHKGSYMDMQLQLDLPFLGSTQFSTELKLDYRKYIMLSKSTLNILAFRFYGHYAFGNISYISLPRVGEVSTARGFKEGRYRGELLTNTEVEYRFPLFLKSNHWILKGLQMNIFANMSYLGAEGGSSWTILPALGIGFRYYLDDKTRISSRADIATGLNDNHAFYFNLNEAF